MRDLSKRPNVVVMDDMESDYLSVLSSEIVEKHFNSINEVLRKHIDQVRDIWIIKLKEYLIRNLKAIGIEFNNEEEFINFCREDLLRVATRPHYYEFYLTKTKQFIGSYSDEPKIEFMGATIKATIG